MRQLITVLAVSSATAFLCAPAAHADEGVGGSRLAAHGYVWDHTAGVKAPPHIQASSYVVADLETGRILAAKDPHGHYRPASALKTLTAITLIPRLDPARTVRPSRAAVDASGSAVGLDTHWTYTARDLFYGLLMQSGNDAAIALCEANGGLQPTLGEMNAEARRIRALDTIARTPNGLDDDPPLTLAQQHSSAYDLALIMKQGLKLPDFRTYVARTVYDWPAPPTRKQREKGKKSGGWEIGTHDHLLLGERYPGMIGGKNGWTSHALGSFVGAATRNGHTIIIALMHAQSDFWGDARSLLDWGFAERAKVAGVGTLVDPVPPPRPVQRKAAAAGRLGGVHAGPGNGTFTWWRPVAAGAGGAVLLAAIAGVIVGLQRRTRPAAGPPHGPSPPPGSGPQPAPGRGHVRPIPPTPPSAPATSPVPETAASPASGPGTSPDPEPVAGPGPAVPERPEGAAAPGAAPDAADTASAGGDPDGGQGNGSGRSSSARHGHDVKVAGVPLCGGRSPSPRETAPNPVQPAPDDAATEGESAVRHDCPADPPEPAGGRRETAGGSRETAGDAAGEDGEPAR